MRIGHGDLWTTLPKGADVTEMFADLEESIAPAELKEPPTPYHFTLAALHKLYTILQPDLITADTVDHKRRICNPPYKKARAAPLRAIAYFSWEKGAQAFLARRVYPTYFDFLSYSHVPAGWGALGVMLKELDDSGRGYRSLVYTAVPDIWGVPILFPYLREATRIGYNAVVVLPLFDEPEPSRFTLLGACVFYLEDQAILPSDRMKAKECLQSFANAMAVAIRRHESRINNPELSRNWDRDLRLGVNYTAELTLTIPPDGNSEVLDKITEEIVRSLSGHDFYSIPDSRREDVLRRSRTIMIVSRDGIDLKFIRKQVLNAVGHACAIADGSHFISYRLFPTI